MGVGSLIEKKYVPIPLVIYSCGKVKTRRSSSVDHRPFQMQFHQYNMPILAKIPVI